MPKRALFFGYIVVAAAFVIATAAWGSNRSFGIFLAPMLEEFGWTRAGISGVFTVNALVMGVLAIVAGRVTDRFGPRVAHLNGLLQVLSQLSASPDQSNAPNSP